MIEVDCPKCGKTFIPAPQHVYREGRKYYCSWTCYNHRHDGVEKHPGYAKRVELLTPNGTLIAEFCSATNASASMGLNIDKIRDACRNHSLYHGYLWRYKNG